MRRFGALTILFVSLFSVKSIYGQSDANAIVRAVYNKMQKARDYSVHAHIQVDIPFIRILPVNAEIFFKQKDKFRIKSRGIAIVPRQGFDQVSKMLADAGSYTAITQGEEKIDTILSTVVVLIPLSDTGDLIIGKLWIDTVQDITLKSQFTTRSSGTIIVEYTYGSQVAYGLPDKMLITVDTEKFKVPENIAANVTQNNAGKNNKKNKKGKIIIELTGYQINKGIPDSIFTD